MSSPRKTGLRRPAVLAFAAATVVAFSAAATGSAQAQPTSAPSTSLYIVQVAGAPLATYTGGVAGIPATKPAAGQKINPNAAAVRAYRAHLDAKRGDVLRAAKVDASRTVYDFATAFNGFAANLTSVEAAKLKSTPGVKNVWKDRILSAKTFTTPAFVGLDGPNGAWTKQFGDPSKAGLGVIVGVIDSGFFPENPSFGPLPSPRPDQAIIDAKWHGSCDPGVEAPVACNNKVIGAQWFNAAGLSHRNPGEFDSPRDFFGHGSHTASTAAGNHGVNATINGVAVGALSGMAPAARLSIYKTLYATADGTQSSGSGVDIVAAINRAVEDGVDVINYSIGDDNDAFEPEELAFLNAAAAGVFVSAAAGNAGPGSQTVDNAMPWETTVAAGTHDRSSRKSVTLGDGRTFTGVGVGAAVSSKPLVNSSAVGLPGANATQLLQCFSNPATLDPAQVAGKIVTCARGGNTRVDKSLAVKNAGGAGMVEYNVTPNSLNADYHFVPTVHVDEVAGAAIKAYAATAGATASLSAAQQVTIEAPQVAAFSSRGPSVSSNGDLLKPDILAPGVDVIAASAPPSHAGNLWDTDSGTSMAAPHIAGIAALLISKNPSWSLMTVKSAIMTTAGITDNQGQPIGDQATGEAGTPFDFGNGEVAGNKAFDPGLVYDSGVTEWLQYSCGIGVHLALSDGSDVCDQVGTVDPSDLNYPTLAVGDLAGKQTLTRKVTNVSNKVGVYAAAVKAPAGFSVKVSPPILVVLPHRTATFTVTISRTNAAFGEYSFGSLTWKDVRGHQVRSTIAVRSVPLAAPGETVGSGTSGSSALAVKSGYSGTLTAAGFGLAASTVTNLPLTATTHAFDPDDPTTGPSTARVDVTLPAGTKVGRFATFGADYPAGTDIDVFVYSTDGGGNLTALVGASTTASAEESVTIREAGTYAVYVDLFAVPAGTTSLTAKHHHWAVGGTNAGNLTVTPASQSVTLGGAATVTVAWSGLAAGGHYLGIVEYGDGTQKVGDTVVTVNS